MRRRDFLGVLGGAAAAWPLALQAQQGERVRRVGVMANLPADDPDMRARLARFRLGLERLGWLVGNNVTIEYRLSPGRPDQHQALAKELVAQNPDVILAQATPITAALKRETQTIPIVFVLVSDPIGSGLVASLAHPGGNLTGLLNVEASIAGKWLTMLKEIAPSVSRVALIANPKTTPFDYFKRAAESIAQSLSIELVSHPVESASEIERVINSFAGTPNGGMIFPPDTSTTLHRDLIISLAASHRIPAVYSDRALASAGGLMSYGPDRVVQFEQAASYVDRILRGTKTADLPVQAPSKFQTVLNLKAAKEIGLTAPPGLLIAADEVIE